MHIGDRYGTDIYSHVEMNLFGLQRETNHCDVMVDNPKT